MRSASQNPRFARQRRFDVACLIVAGWLGVGCQRGGLASSTPGAADDGMTCDGRKTDLIGFVQNLPDTALAATVEIELPEAALGGVPGRGALLEISKEAVAFEGERFAHDSLKARLDWLRPKLGALRPATTSSGPLVLHVAAAYDTDVRTLRQYLADVPSNTELRLLFRVPTVDANNEGDDDAGSLAARLLAERNPKRRQELAAQGFAEFASCSGIEQAVVSVEGVSSKERWPNLKQALSRALPGCACDELEASSLKQLIVAEQRAGTMALGSMPLSFIRDQRCGASMPLRSMQKLLRQIEGFDQEFSGEWREEELSFDKVVTNERLLNYFCDALPGETLAALQRDHSTVYWKLPGGQCQGWQFDPLSPGAPMGTWRRVSEAGGAGPELSFHYWQGAEQIRVYGPTPSPDSKPTDQTRWDCETEYQMKAVDETSVRLTGGHWFFSHEACRNAPPRATLASSCVVQRALGTLPAQEGEPDLDRESGQ
jgi:hypothetical protein